MLEYLSVRINVFYVTAILLAFLAAVLVVVFIATKVLRMRERGPRFASTRNAQNDLTNTMIMFQTMRDILEQQKDLARQLNVSLDKKVRYIKTVVDTALDDLREMRETARGLADELTAAKAELAALRTVPGPAAGGGAEAGDAAARDGAQDAPAAPSTLEALARPALEEPPENVLDNWVGLDSGEEAEEPEPEPVSAPPETPENAEAARNAFRALLNLETTPADAKPRKEDAERDGGNGRASTTPLKKRIYEYSDVGMSVSEIARELGLGKGEVRLILNLRKDRGE